MCWRLLEAGRTRVQDQADTSTFRQHIRTAGNMCWQKICVEPKYKGLFSCTMEALDLGVVRLQNFRSDQNCKSGRKGRVPF